MDRKVKKYEEKCLDVFRELGISLPDYKIIISDELGKEFGQIQYPETEGPIEILLNRALVDYRNDVNPLFGTIGRLLLIISDANYVEPTEGFRNTYGLNQAEWHFAEMAGELEDAGIPANTFWDLSYIEGDEDELSDVECRCTCHLIVPSNYIGFTVTCPFCKQEIEMQGNKATYPEKKWRFLVKEYHPLCDIIDFPYR